MLDSQETVTNSDGDTNTNDPDRNRRHRHQRTLKHREANNFEDFPDRDQEQDDGEVASKSNNKNINSLNSVSEAARRIYFNDNEDRIEIKNDNSEMDDSSSNKLKRKKESFKRFQKDNNNSWSGDED